MRTAGIVFVIAGMLGATTVHGADNEERDFTVMTRNVYHGVNAEIFDVPRATSFLLC